jgi:hypothetical protein
MFHAALFLVGIAAFVLAASVCLSRAKRVGRSVEANLTAHEAASVCLSAGRRAADGAPRDPTWDEIARWQEMKVMWMQWYGRVREKALLRQEAMYSWARTLGICAAICLVGIVLEATFDQHVTVDQISAGFRQPTSTASSLQTSQQRLSQSKPTPTTNRPSQK